jgi:hypothetical protein
MSVEGGLILASNLLRPGKLKTAVAWTSVGYTAGRRLWAIYNRRRKTEQFYQIKIDENDDLYDEVCSWFMEQIPEEEQYSVEAETLYQRARDKKSREELDSDFINSLIRSGSTSLDDGDEDGERYEYIINLMYNEKRSKPIEIDGHEIRVQHVIPGFNTEEDADGSYEESEEDRRKRGQYASSRYVIINCPTIEAKRAVIRKLESTLKEPEFAEKQPSFFQASSWGEFKSNRGVPLRKLESVILKPGQIETIVEDIQRFLKAEERYGELGIPYHRGILLHGQPGTGKTSIAAAIANHLKLDVYYVSLSSVKDNAALESLLNGVRQRSVLLLEEVDTCVAATDNGRDKEPQAGITMDVLLQKLDGMSTPHGLITIMTTNRLHVLDEALIRPGRADLKVEITAVDTAQLHGICKHFLGYIPEGLPELRVEYGVTPADLVEVFKQNIYDVKAAGEQLVTELNERVAQITATQDAAIMEEIGTF